MTTPLTVRARRTVFVVPFFLLGLVASVANSAEPGKQPDLGNVEAFCNSLFKTSEFADLGLSSYPQWKTEHKKGQRVECNWIGAGKGSGLYVLSIEATCGKQRYDEAFCAKVHSSFRSGQEVLQTAGIGKTAKGFFDEKVEGAVCHTLALGLSGDTDFVYLDNGCYFLLSQVAVERLPKETQPERKKQAKLAVARKAALRMRAGAR